MPLPGLVQLSELAKRWGITSDSVLRYHVRQGGLRAMQSGRTTWFRIEDVTLYEQRLKNHWLGEIKKLQRRLKRIAQPLPLMA